MKELQSVQAPVSVQKGSVGAQLDASEPHGLPLPITDNDIASSTTDETGFQRPSHDFTAPSNHRQHTKLGKSESWVGSKDSTIGISSSKLHTEAVPKYGGLERVVDFQLLEEENLMSAGGTRDKRMLAFMPTGQHSSPLFQPPQMTKVRPPYPHLEPHHAHMNSHMKFLGPEPIYNHDSPANHQFSSIDAASDANLGNNPPHMLPDFPRGGPVSHHSNQATGFIREMNQMQGFPFGPRQPTIGSRGVPIPANPPEALQRLIEVELRANSRQIHPFAPGHSQGMYGHEVDMGLRHG
ncbi:UNVERIFIED_CONTAM: hypothetical protein Sradi_0507800 [Sesamum radiatum]|uniref:Uncharacterized protein n=1 Tax=Sesamum radiatum TaxID=300843 RepID=A0AAW2VI01_SESRA